MQSIVAVLASVNLKIDNIIFTFKKKFSMYNALGKGYHLIWILVAINGLTRIFFIYLIFLRDGTVILTIKPVAVFKKKGTENT